MDERSTGIVLRTRPLTETSLIVQWLTADFGRISTVAKGARRAKSTFAGKLDIFYVADFSFQRSRRSDLHILREVAVREHHQGLRLEIGKLQQAAYLIQLLELTTESDTPLLEHFELLFAALGFISSSNFNPLAVLAYEVKMLALLGLLGYPQDIGVDAPAQELLGRLARAEWQNLSEQTATPAAFERIEHYMRLMLADHFGRVPKGRAAALA